VLSTAKQKWKLSVEEAGKDFVIVRIQVIHLSGRTEDLYAKIHKDVDLEFTQSFDVTTVNSSIGEEE
jgi:polyisoprenoid-binding protein YceI